MLLRSDALLAPGSKPVDATYDDCYVASTMHKLLLAVFVLLHVPVLAQDTQPGATPCRAPSFEKVGAFTLPACGAPSTEPAKISGTILVTDRTPAQLRQVILTRKGKMLAHATVTPAADNPNASTIVFEYAEPGETYQPPLDVVIVPKCGPIISISVDRPGRCG